MPLKLNSSGGGSVTLDVPSTGSALTITVPAIAGTIITTADTGTVTETMLASNSVNTNEIVAAAVTPAKMSEPMTLMTANSAISGSTFVDFTGIPSWADRITILFSGVSTSGTSFPVIQIGSGSFTITGYASTGGNSPNAASPGVSTGTVGFILEGGTVMSVATATRAGRATLYNITGNTWVLDSVIANTASTQVAYAAGTIALAGTLDRVRITTVNGTDTFDAGTINIIYE